MLRAAPPSRRRRLQRAAPPFRRVLFPQAAPSANVRRLLVVEDVFTIAGRGVILAPDIELHGPAMIQLRVELRRPDGTTTTIDALAHLPMTNPPQTSPRMRYVVLLPNLTKSDVPIGTEVWLAAPEHGVA